MIDHDTPRRTLLAIATAGATFVMIGGLAAQPGPVRSSWWAPGQGTPLPAFATYGDEYGKVGVLNVSGAIDTNLPMAA